MMKNISVESTIINYNKYASADAQKNLPSFEMGRRQLVSNFSSPLGIQNTYNALN